MTDTNSWFWRPPRHEPNIDPSSVVAPQQITPQRWITLCGRIGGCVVDEQLGPDRCVYCGRLMNPGVPSK